MQSNVCFILANINLVRMRQVAIHAIMKKKKVDCDTAAKLYFMLPN